ncbi:MAG: leucine-rich repeat protein [Leucobacter sp.]
MHVQARPNRRRSRLLALLLAPLLAASGILLVPAAANAAPVITHIDGIQFEADDANSAAGAAVTGYDWTAGGLDPVIPASVDISGQTYEVKSIGIFAFSSQNLNSVEIPDSVETIAQAAFRNNNLTTVSLPSSLTTVGNDAFRNNYLESVTIPNLVTSIGISAFRDNALTAVTLPDSITTIEEDVFRNNNLASVSIPNSVTSIGISAFRDNALTTLSIPNSVTTVGNDAFRNNQLESVTIPNSVTSIGIAAFWDNSLTTVTIPDSITTIENDVFRNNNLESVSIPNSVTSIGISAFRYNALTALSISSSVTTIGNDAFRNNQLESVSIPDSVTSIGISAFRDNALTAVSLPDSITTIEDDVFRNNNLESVSIPNSVTSIGYSTFRDNALTAVTFSSSVATIENDAFRNNNLESVVFPDSVTSIGYAAFRENALTSVTLPESITMISGDSFRDNSLTSLVIPDSVTSIEYAAFRNNALTEVTIPDSVIEIEVDAFRENQLVSVILPDSLTTLRSNVFGSNPLTQVRFLGTAPTTITDGDMWNASLGTAPGLVVYYESEHGEPATPGGFTTPLWHGYATYPYSTTYTVSFESGGGTAVPSATVRVMQPVAEPAAPTREGHTFTGWFTDAALTTPYDFSTAVTSDVTLYAGWEILVLTVSFDSGGGTAIDPVSVNYGDTAAEPADPTREGFTFAGWFTDADATDSYDFDAPVTDDLTLYAGWDVVVLTVSFDSDGGSPVAPQSVNYGDIAAEPAEPTREGFTFAGWFTDAALTTPYDFSTAVTSDVTLYAGWEILVLTVSFDSGGGTAIDPVSVNYGDPVAEPGDPTREGYTFAGWFKDADATDAYDFDAPVTEVLTLYAGWDAVVLTVTFDTGGGSAIDPVSVSYGDPVAEPAEPTREGYSFAGWFVDFGATESYDFANPVTNGITLYAGWDVAPAPTPVPDEGTDGDSDVRPTPVRDGGLPETGDNSDVGLLLGSGALLLIGAGLLLARRLMRNSNGR